MDSYPLFSKEYYETDTEKYNQEKAIFSRYLQFTHQFVNSIQCNLSSPIEENFLSFYPIAKNIRFTSSLMSQNILLGKSSFVETNARGSEPDFWKDFKQMGDWYPWLWARGREGLGEQYTNKEGWAHYFTSFLPIHQPIPIDENIIPEPPSEHLLTFFIYLSCLRYTFQLNTQYKNIMNDYQNKMEWPKHSQILAIQIRRGETCTPDGSMTDRPFFTLEQYLEKTDLLISKMGYEYIYISTDSNEEIERIQQYRPEWKLLYLPIDRSQFYRMKDSPVDIEVACCLEPNRIPFTVDTALADLYFISLCQGYISTISVSEFSRCGWFLQMAEQGYITPYVNMNDESLDMSLRDKLLLL